MNDSKKPEKLHQESDTPRKGEVIDLTDVVENTAEEEVIELSDVVEPLPVDKGEAEENTFIELTDVVTEDAAESKESPESVPKDSSERDKMLMDEVEEEHAPADDLADSLGVDLAAGKDARSITPDQLDAAIERVVKKMLSEKIDTILNRVIEKEVAKEIDRIKRLLSDELSDTDDTA
jgi:hypothetical protein